MRVSVVIPVHNAPLSVKACLNSVLRSDPLPFEVILIDDASGPETKIHLSSYAGDPRVKLFQNTSRRGYTFSANRGAHLAEGDVIVFLNSDCIVPSFWLRTFVDGFKQNPKIGIIGCLSNSAGWFSVPERKRSDSIWIANSLPKEMDAESFASSVQTFSKKSFYRVPYINGFCFAVRADTFKALSGFDTNLFPDGYGEEIDLCLRAKKLGKICVFSDELFVFHEKSASYGETRKRKLSAQGEAALKKRWGALRLKFYRRWLRHDLRLRSVRKKTKNLSQPI